MTTKEEILTTGQLIDSSDELSIHFKKYHHHFKIEGQYRIRFFRDSPSRGPQISDGLLSIVHFHETPTPEMLALISEESFKHYNSCIRTIDYGMVSDELLRKHNHNTEEANREYFSIHSPMDSFEKLALIEISISERKNKADEIYFYPGLNFQYPGRPNMV
jgi:hypothetical protein